MSSSTQSQTLAAPPQHEPPVETGVLDRPHAAVDGKARARRDSTGSEAKHSAVVGFAEPAPPAPPCPPAPVDSDQQTGRDFARLRAVVNITDPDPQRAEMTRQLLQSLAAQLGLHAEQVEIRVDAEARRRTQQRAARGLMDDGIVYFDPRSYHPATREGRYLLGHEVAHVAQRDNKGSVYTTELALSQSVAEAELEADRIGHAFASGSAFASPRLSLPARVVAADSGVASVGEAAPPLGADRKELDALVAQTHQSELARIVDLLSYALTDWAVTDEDVRKVLTILEGFNMVTARSLVAALPAKYRKRLHNNLDTGHYKRQRTQVLAVYWGSDKSELKAHSGELRTAFNNMDLRQLSPLESAAAQYALQSMNESDRRQLQQGKKRDEIEELLAFAPDPRDETKQLDEALKQERQLLTEREEAQKAYSSGERSDALEQMVKLIKKMIDRWSSHGRKEAQGQAQQDVLSILAMLGPYLNRKAELRAIVDHLVGVKTIPSKNPKTDNPTFEEQYDYLDLLIRKVPVKALYLEGVRRRVFFRLLMFRPPYKNEELAEDLASTSFWVPVDSEDAYLAFLLVKAMPPHSRQAFFSAEGGSKWTLVMEKMSQQQRESESLNFYTGGKDEEDKNALLSQLISDEVWGPQSASRLEGLIRMAIAAGEHEFVFKQSEQRNAYTKEWLKPLVEKFMLFNPNGKDNKGRKRDRYYPEILEGTAWYERGLSGFIYHYGVQGLDFVFSSDDVEVGTKSVGGKGLNLVELQDMFGGNFLGVRFTEFNQLGQEGRDARKKKSGVNFANVKWDTGLGILKMDAPKLAFDAIRYPVDDIEFQTSRGILNDLNVTLRYSTSKKPEPSMIDVKVGDLTLHDVALVTPEWMKTANTVGVGGLRISAGASGSNASKFPGPRSGPKFPIPVIGASMGAAWNIFLGSMWSGLVNIVTLGQVNPLVGISGSSSEMGSNLMKPTKPLGFNFSFNSLKLVGVTTSAGQFVESIELKNLVLNGGGDAASYRTALTRSKERIEARLSKAREEFGLVSPDERDRISRLIRSLDQQREHTELELKALGENEKEVARLEGLQKQSPKSLTPQDRLRLRSLKAQLSGAVLDVDSVSIKGIGGVSSESTTLTNVHGQGHSINAALGMLTDSTFITDFLTGKENRPIIKGSGKDQDVFTLDIGHVDLPNLKLRGAIPKAEDAKKDFEKFDAKYQPWRKSHQDEHARLKSRMDLAKQREDFLVNPGINRMTEKQQERFKEIERELDKLEAKAQLTVGRIVMEGTTLSITDNKRIAVGADELLVQDVKRGDLQIREIKGSHVQVGVEIHGGIAGLEEWRKNLQGLGIRGESVIASGIKNEEIGLEVDRATLMGIDEASLDIGSKNVSARITTKLVLVEGVRLRNFEDRLVMERDYLKAKPERKPKEQKRLDEVQASLEGLDKLRKQIADAEAELAKAKTKKQKAEAQERRNQAQTQLDRWAEGLIAETLAVKDLDVDVIGLGDVMSEAYDPASALESGVEARGRGGSTGKRMFTGVTGTNVGLPGLSGSKVSIGETGGRITHSKAGTLFDGIHIDTIAGQGIDWRDGQRHVFSRGETSIQGIDVTAFVGEQEIVISKLDVGAVLADQLGYEDEATGISVLVESGGLGGIHVTNLTISLPANKAESAKITGKVITDTIDDLKIKALIRGIRAKGTLAGSNLSVDFVTDRKRVFTIGDLKLRGGEITEPGTTNNIHVSFRGLKGAVTQEDLENGETKYTLSKIGLADLSVRNGRWTDGKQSIAVNGEASLHGVTLDAEVLQGKKEADGKGGMLKQLKIVRMGVEQIKAADIHWHKGAVPPDPKKPGDKGSAPLDVDLGKGTILGLEVTGIDLMKDFSKMTGKVSVKDSVDIQKLRIAVGDAGKDQIVTTLSLKAYGKEAKEEGMRGRELSATFFGPAGKKIELGTIKEITGDFEGLGAKTGFSTGQVTMSPIEINGDGTEVKIADVEIKDIKLLSPKYTDGKGTDVKMDSANVTAAHIQGVVAKFGELTDKDGKKVNGMTSLGVTGMKFDFVGAQGFAYSGKTTISSSKSSSTTIKADKAELSELVFEPLSHNFKTHVTELNANLKKTSVTGFMANFADTVAGKTSSTEMFGNIEAGGMHAKLTLTGTKAVGEDWTSVDGLFELTDSTGLGLTNMRVVHTDKEGEKVELGVLDPKTSRVDLTGLKVHFAPNGTMYAEFDELAGKGLKINVGGATIRCSARQIKEGGCQYGWAQAGPGFRCVGRDSQGNRSGGREDDLRGGPQRARQARQHDSGCA